MIGVLWGLGGAGLIGVSDCMARVTARRVSLAVLILVIMAGGTVLLGAVIAATGAWPRWHGYGWGVAVGSGVLNVVALALLFTAILRGPVTVASPAASSFTIMVVGLNALAGEPFSAGQAVAALIVFGGIVMLARPGRGTGPADSYDAAHLRLTALFGMAAAFSVALRMFLAQEASDALGPVETVFLTRASAAVCLGAFILIEIGRGKSFAWPERSVMPLVLAQVVLEVAALAAFLFGSAGTGRVGAAIGFAAFPAVTAITAWLWLHEAIGMRRALWMGVVAGGIVLAVLSAP